MILDLIARTIVHVAIAAKPRIERWWDDQARPAIKSRWNKVSRRKRSARNRELLSQHAAAEASTMVEAAVANSSYGEISALDGSKASVGSAEVRVRLLLALMARAFSGEQIRIVSNSLIGDDEFAELKRTVDELTSRQVADIIKALEVNSFFLHGEKLAELEKAVGVNGNTNKTLQGQLCGSDEH